MVATIRSRAEAAGGVDRRRGTHPCAASAQVAALLHGPRREAAILHRGRHAVYLRDRGHHLAVLGRDAVAVPCGLQTLWRDVGDVRSVLVGGGSCAVDGRELTVRRFVDVRVAPLPHDAGAAGTPVPLDTLRTEVCRHLPADAAWYEALRAADPAAAGLLLGRGSGLTPLGDDILAGWLVARYALGHRGGAIATAVLAHGPVRTTAVSAALLAHAVRGEAVPQLRAYVAARGHPASLPALRAVGHTSGTGLALGAALALSPPPAGVPAT